MNTDTNWMDGLLDEWVGENSCARIGRAQIFSTIQKSINPIIRFTKSVFICVHPGLKFYKTMTIRAGGIWQFEFRNL